MPTDPSHKDYSLKGKKILVACSAKKMSALVDGLRASGAKVLPLPIIEIRDIDDKSRLDQAIASLRQYSWIIFTSAHGVLYFSKRLDERKINRDIFRDIKICAVGPATAKSLQERGFKTDLVPEVFVAEGIIESLKKFSGGLDKLAGKHILIPRAKEARNELPDALVSAGAHVDIAVCYQTVGAKMSENDIAAIKAEIPDMAVFTSSSTVKYTMEVLGPDAGKKLLEKSTVAALGPITAHTVESFGKQVEIIPKQSTIVALIRSIGEYYSRQ